MWQAKSRLLPPALDLVWPCANRLHGIGSQMKASERARPHSAAKSTANPTLSGDRTGLRQSSLRKREFLLFGLETFGKFSRRLPFSGHQRLWTIAQKPYKMRYFRPIEGHSL